MIILRDGRKYFKVNPQDDITPLESVRIAMLMAVDSRSCIKFEDKIKEWGLERHFERF